MIKVSKTISISTVHLGPLSKFGIILQHCSIIDGSKTVHPCQLSFVIDPSESGNLACLGSFCSKLLIPNFFHNFLQTPWFSIFPFTHCNFHDHPSLRRRLTAGETFHWIAVHCTCLLPISILHSCSEVPFWLHLQFSNVYSCVAWKVERVNRIVLGKFCLTSIAWIMLKLCVPWYKTCLVWEC